MSPLVRGAGELSKGLKRLCGIRLCPGCRSCPALASHHRGHPVKWPVLTLGRMSPCLLQLPCGQRPGRHVCLSRIMPALPAIACLNRVSCQGTVVFSRPCHGCAPSGRISGATRPKDGTFAAGKPVWPGFKAAQRPGRRVVPAWRGFGRQSRIRPQYIVRSRRPGRACLILIGFIMRHVRQPDFFDAAFRAGSGGFRSRSLRLSIGPVRRGIVLRCTAGKEPCEKLAGGLRRLCGWRRRRARPLFGWNRNRSVYQHAMLLTG